MNESIQLKLDILDVDVLLSMLTKYAKSTSHLGDKNDALALAKEIHTQTYL